MQMPALRRGLSAERRSQEYFGELKPWFSGKRLRAWQTGETRDRAPGVDRRWKLWCR